jgi:hypothetical protein
VSHWRPVLDRCLLTICSVPSTVLDTGPTATKKEECLPSWVGVRATVEVHMVPSSESEKSVLSRAWWYTSVISALGRLRQEKHKLESSLGYTVSN